jgi:hypothetical protein
MKNKWYNGSMLESQDIQKLMEVLATKEDIQSVEKRLDGLDSCLVNGEVQLTALSQSIVSIDDRMNVLEAKQDQIISILDKWWVAWKGLIKNI